MTATRKRRRLGFRLFQRSTRRLTPTEAGDAYLARIEPLVDEMEHARDDAAEASDAVSGTLRLSASVTFGQRRIVPLLAGFRALHPRLTLECLFNDANFDLIADRIDLAVRLAPTIEGNLIVSRLMSTSYRVVAAPSYLAWAPPLAQPEDLRDHRCILFDLRAYRTRWLFRDSAGQASEVPVAGDLVLSPAAAVHEACLAGLGPALLPNWLIDHDIARNALVDVFPDHEVTATSFDTAAWLVYPSRDFVPRKVRAMIDFLRARMR